MTGPHRVERIAQGPVSDTERAAWSLLGEERCHSWDWSADLAAQVVATGRIVARYEDDTRPREYATRITVVDGPDLAALLVDNAGCYRVYRVAGVDLAAAIARSILRSGSGYNW